MLTFAPETNHPKTDSMKVIPAIDLLDGKVVRLHKGDYEQATVYNNEPLKEAWKFREAGFSHIHIVDLNGAREGRFKNLDIIREIIEETGLSVQSGGGIRTYEDVSSLLDAGISQLICSSMAVKNKEEWYRLLREHPGSAILGMDLKNGKVAFSGWTEVSDEPLRAFLQPMLDSGLRYVLSTDISKDGTLAGPNFELYKKLKADYPGLNFIASGGVANAADLQQLERNGLYGVVVGRAYYEQKLSLEEMKNFDS